MALGAKCLRSQTEAADQMHLGSVPRTLGLMIEVFLKNGAAFSVLSLSGLTPWTSLTLIGEYVL